MTFDVASLLTTVVTITLSIFVLILLVALCSGLYKVLYSDQSIDRFLAMQLMGTTSVALLLILDQLMQIRHSSLVSQQSSAILDLAVVFASLSAVTIVAFIQRGKTDEGDS